MERRHITFLLLAASLFLTFNLLNNMNKPDEEPEVPQEELVEADADGITPIEGDGDAPQVEEEKVVYDREFATLGSVDPADGYRMLVTLDSKGGSVHRVELSNPSYQSYEHDDDGGYLGQLAFDETDGKGVKINVVGPGTPAAVAVSKTDGASNGLKPGDTIVSVNDEPITTIKSFQEVMHKTKPRGEVEVVVQRPAESEEGESQKLAFTIGLRKHPIEVIKPDMSMVPQGADGLPTVKHHPPAFLTTLAQIGSLKAKEGFSEIKNLPSLFDANWKTNQVADNEVHFELTLYPSDLKELGSNKKLRLVKKFRLTKVTDEMTAAEGFHIDYDLEIHNESSDTLSVAYKQLGPTGLPLEGWWYAHKISHGFGTAGIRDVTWESEDGGDYELFTVYSLVDRAQKEGADPNTPLYNLESNVKTKYAGVDAQYFNCTLLLDHEKSTPEINLAQATAAPIGPIDETYEPKTDCTFALQSRAYPIGGGQAVSQNFRIFAGPKTTEVLQHYGLGKVEYYGWFSPVSSVLLIVLHALHSVLQNYGLAIIVLTLMVRGAMHPISRKQAKNMQIQQALAPEIKRISDQYKDDPEGRLKAQQDLFKKHNFNPVGGCLMMFIQLPIFLGLYRALAVDFELRQAPLIPGISWCSNLAAPDQLLYWGDWMPEFLSRPTGFPSLGPYLNILPLVTVALFLVQQKLFMPPPQDEQQAMQQRIMTIMMIFMGVMFFKVPSGLCIYFITSSIWGIVERKLLPKPKNMPVVVEAKKEEVKQPRIRQAKKKK
ncbi:YidC/Oxa1 family insertase periplasmic-domain containing protein [Bremerella sp. T1]|uniref:YidC/Oxa1 family insertase periplasmic-domain containing protein n=1 Tax=Bremerella sp. TYQ1 TaxID=3119568 RepID=UPI001CCF7787|nr:YidC/Oxa1 family insertase periplasmic-domain containing protein [Bremerella volcania]UBM36806.1 YidC/Oxa1 family insertase periplasmic-domain containing protein [Bremerella volcania]